MALFGFAESGAQGLRAAIAPDGELNGAACRNFMNHAPELRGAFHALPVDLRHDVVSFRPAFAAGLSGTIFPSTTPRSAGSLSSLAFSVVTFVCLDAEPACAIAVHQDPDAILFDVGHARQLDDLRLVELNHCWSGLPNLLLFDLFLCGKSGSAISARLSATAPPAKIRFRYSLSSILLNP